MFHGAGAPPDPLDGPGGLTLGGLGTGVLIRGFGPEEFHGAAGAGAGAGAGFFENKITWCH